MRMFTFVPSKAIVTMRFASRGQPCVRVAVFEDSEEAGFREHLLTYLCRELPDRAEDQVAAFTHWLTIQDRQVGDHWIVVDSQQEGISIACVILA